MALKVKISKEDFDHLSEAEQSFYKEGDEGYVLDVEGVDDHPEVQGLKNKVNELQGETKKEREQRQKLEREQKEAERQRAEQDGEYQELYQKTQQELEQERENARKFQEQVQQRDIRNASQGVARQLASKDAKRADVLADYASRYAKVENGEVVYEIGGVKVDEGKVTEHLKSEFPFLVDGSQASGGGAAGNDGSGASASKQMSREQWDQMSHADRSAAARDGYKVTEPE